MRQRSFYRVWCSGVATIVLLGVLVASPGSVAVAKPKTKHKAKTPVTTKVPVNKLYQLTATGTYDALNEGNGEKGTISLDVGVRVQSLKDYVRTTGSGEIQIIGYFSNSNMPDNKVCQTPAAGKILAQVDLVDYDTTSELSALPPVGTVNFSVLLRLIAPGTGPGVGCPNGSTLTFDGLFATSAFNQAAAALSFKPTGETVHRTSTSPLVRYDITFTLVPLN